MVTTVQLDNVISIADHQSQVSGVQGTKPTEPEQVLPVKGNILPQESEEPELKTDELENIVRDMNKQVQLIQRELQFSVDGDSGRTVITVLDKETDEVIRQIPSDEVLHFAKVFQEHLDIEIFTAVT